MSGTVSYATGPANTSPGHFRRDFPSRIWISLSLLLLIAACVIPSYAAGVPTANFTSNVTSGIVPFDVNFTDTSTGSPTLWNWSFGEGTFSDLQSPVHTYTVAGNYTVSLIAANATGNNTRVVVDYMIAETVKADFTANKTSGTIPLVVKFTDSSANSPVSWNWSFGDGNFSEDKHPVHTYVTAGWYNITLVANNTYGSGQKVKTQYINVAAKGTVVSTDITGIIMMPAPSSTLEPSLNRSALGATLTVSGNDATVTNPSASFSSMVFHYNSLTDIAGNVSGNYLQSVQMTTVPLLITLGSIGPTEVYVALNLWEYTPGNTISILMSDAPSTSDAAAFSTVAGTTQPLQALSYEMDITTSSSYVDNADIYFTVPLTWSNTYGSGNIRLFHIHDSPYSVSALPTSLYSTSSTTATYRATTTTFSRFSPGAISPPSSPVSPSSPYSPPVYSGGTSSDSGTEPGPKSPIQRPKVEIAPKVELPKEIPQLKEPQAPLDKPSGPAVSKPDVPAPAAAASPPVSPAISHSSADTITSALQEGGARAAGYVTSERGVLPADTFLPSRVKPLGAVAAGVAMAGVVALAGSAGATASGGLLGTLLGRIIAFLQHLIKPVSDFIGDRFTGHVESHTVEVLERQTAPLSRSLDASRNPFIPRSSQILILGAGAGLYGLAFVVAERAGLMPEVIGTYIIVSGLVVTLHELLHHLVARRFVMKSEMSFSIPGLLMTFFTAWFFGNVFSQPLTTKIPEDSGIDRKARGMTMLAGPLVSLASAAAFALLIPVGGIWTMIGTTGLSINLVQVVFSLIPVKPQDGQPVFTWNRFAWAAVFVPVFAIYLLVYLL